tara:strand:- start:227 stop:979 length:753 start_codon:yes stop_codon:yes gene_type:complete
MIRSKKLLRFKNINHAFFNNIGGVSKGIYKSLNCGPGSKDKAKNIKKNLSIVKSIIGCKNNDLILLKQIHSNKIFKIFKKPKKKLIGDGAITNKRGVALGILTADCIPLIVFDKKLDIIGVAHAGWKGAFRGIVEKLILKFIKFGSKKRDLIAVIGPCIQVNNYEVKSDFYNKFVSKSIYNKRFFKIISNKIYFNLSKYVKYLIYSTGVTNVDTIEIDTYTRKNNFFSSRFSRRKKNNDYGRNISVIMIK